MSGWAVFLDKDGTLLEDVPFNVDPAQMRFAHGACEGLHLLGRLRVPLAVISNQGGVGLGRFGIDDLIGVEKQLERMFASCGAALAGFYYCPHHPQSSDPRYSGPCSCRKPAPGLLQRAARTLGVDAARCWMVGDILDDIEAGRTAGCRTILVADAAEIQLDADRSRTPHYVVPNLRAAAHVITVAETSRNGIGIRM